MRIIRSPLRVSLFGGGTDSFDFCSRHGSTIISFALSCSIYVTHNFRPTGGYRLSYSEIEELEHLDESNNTILQAWAKCNPHFKPCTITIVSDIPKGTGLGSSAALTVALMKLANWELRGEDLVQNAFDLERSVSPGVGWQDYLPAVYGGFHVYTLDGSHIGVSPVPPVWHEMIQEYGLLLYTGRSREANSVPGWGKSDGHLLAIKTLADEVAGNVHSITKVEKLAGYLHKTWELKNKIEGVSDVLLDAQYRRALELGTLAGKVCGAGAGGCWFLLVPPKKKQAVVDGLGLVEIPFEIADWGVTEWDTDVRV